MATKTMFGPTKYQYLGDMVSLRNPSSARGSVRELKREFKEATTSDKKLRLARATQLAANRAKVMSKNTRLSVAEQGEGREMHKLYRDAAAKMFSAYKRTK